MKLQSIPENSPKVFPSEFCDFFRKIFYRIPMNGRFWKKLCYTAIFFLNLGSPRTRKNGKVIIKVFLYTNPGLQACNFIKKRLQHRCFAKLLKTFILKNQCERLLLLLLNPFNTTGESGDQRFSDVSRGYRKRLRAYNGSVAN